MGIQESEYRYLELSNKYLLDAEELLRGEDYPQASEKFWGAAAVMVKAVADKMGVELRSHGEIRRFVNRLKDELNEPELNRLFAVAADLHQNFYENWLPGQAVIDNGELVEEFVDRLKRAF